MDYHQNARLTVHSRELLAKMVLQRGGTLKAAAAAFNMSPETAAKWTRRFRQLGPAGLRDLSSKPHRSPRQRVRRGARKSFGRKSKTETVSCTSQTRHRPQIPGFRASCKWLILWWARRDLNPQPRDYESPALTVELQALQ